MTSLNSWVVMNLSIRMRSFHAECNQRKSWIRSNFSHTQLIDPSDQAPKQINYFHRRLPCLWTVDGNLLFGDTLVLFSEKALLRQQLSRAKISMQKIAYCNLCGGWYTFRFPDCKNWSWLHHGFSCLVGSFEVFLKNAEISHSLL